MFLKRLLKNTFVGQRYTLENLYLTKFSSEWKKFYTLLALPGYQAMSYPILW